MTEEKAVARREPINIDFTTGIIPQNYKEAMQMAALLHKSRLVHKSLDTLEKVAIASFMCLELGRPIMTGIQDVAVINGKAGIYGDAALGIVRASGLLERFKEWEEGTPYTPEWTFYCLMKRKGMPDERKGSWSWADSIRAGFDKIGPPSPWAKYTRRMMQFKARNFPLRDEFGDVLKGMRLSEDNLDTIDMYESPNGSYTRPETTEKAEADPAPEIEKGFTDFAKTLDIPADGLEEFVKATAKANSIPVSTVMTEALENKAEFAVAAKAWWEQNQPDEPTLFDTLKSMRPNSSDKNRTAFRELVFDTLDEIREWPETQRDHLTLKWNKTFEGEPFSEVLNPPEETPESEEEPPEEESQMEGGTPIPPDTGSEEPNRIPPWQRRRLFLEKMKDLHDKNKTVYFNVMGGEGYESANDVPEDAESENRILDILESEIPG